MNTRWLLGRLFPVVGALAAPIPLDAEIMTPAQKIQSITGLVGYWDFAEEPGQDRVSAGTTNAHPLLEANGPVQRVTGGPLSGYAARLDGTNFFSIPYAQTADLNIYGADAQVSMVAFLRLDELINGTTVAGMWNEGFGRGDDSGSRQYALLMNIHAYGGRGNVTPHISSEGGVSRRADGSGLPWNVDYAASPQTIETNEWISVGFTYDGASIKAFYNGEFENREVDPVADNRTDRYFTETSDGNHRGINGYYHGRGIFEYDPALHSETKPQGGADFTVGARVVGGDILRESMKGDFGGLMVFDRALSEQEMRTIHEAALPAAVTPPDAFFGETFANTTGADNISIQAFNANTGAGWQAVFGPGAADSNATDRGPGVRIADSTLASGHFLAIVPDSNAATSAFAWADDLDPLDVTDAGVLSARLNNRGVDDGVRFAIRIDGQWYVSEEAFGNEVGGIGFDDWSNAEVLAFEVTTAANAWRSLDVESGQTLQLGLAVANPLSGMIDAVGLYGEVAAGGLIRVDDFQLTAIPEPNAAIFSPLLLLLASRRRKPCV